MLRSKSPCFSEEVEDMPRIDGRQPGKLLSLGLLLLHMIAKGEEHRDNGSQAEQHGQYRP